MKPTLASDPSTRSAVTVQALGILLGFSLLLVLTSYASDPASWNDPGWWNARGVVLNPQVVTNNGVVTTNYVANNNAIANQGQLKAFTVAAVNELNADLTNSGGAGPALSNLVYGWHQDYVTNGYATNSANPARPFKTNDYQAVNVGQLKYVAKLVYTQLSSAGYTGLYPSWIPQNTNTDNAAATLAQLKQVFDFNLSIAPPLVSNLTASVNPTNAGEVDVSWTLPANNNATSIVIWVSADGGNTWTNAGSVSPTSTTFAATGLASASSYLVNVTGLNSANFSGPGSGGGNGGGSAATAVPLPLNPSNFMGTSTGASPNVVLTWTPGGSSNYIIKRSVDGVNFTNTVASALPPTNGTFTDGAAISGHVYIYELLSGSTTLLSQPEGVLSAPTGDADGDGVPNNQDGWPLEPSLAPPRLPINRYAVIDLGANVTPAFFNDQAMMIDTNNNFWQNGVSQPITTSGLVLGLNNLGIALMYTAFGGSSPGGPVLYNCLTSYALPFVPVETLVNSAGLTQLQYMTAVQNQYSVLQQFTMPLLNLAAPPTPTASQLQYYSGDPNPFSLEMPYVSFQQAAPLTEMEALNDSSVAVGTESWTYWAYLGQWLYYMPTMQAQTDPTSVATYTDSGAVITAGPVEGKLGTWATGITSLGMPPSYLQISPQKVNNAGTVFGSYVLFDAQGTPGPSRTAAFSGSAPLVANLGTDSSGHSYGIEAVNDQNSVLSSGVIINDRTAGTNYLATVTSLPNFAPPVVFTNANSDASPWGTNLNNSLQVAHGKLWQNAHDYDLTTLIAPNSGFTGVNALMANNNGAIVGTATSAADGQSHGVMLLPVTFTITRPNAPASAIAQNPNVTTTPTTTIPRDEIVDVKLTIPPLGNQDLTVNLDVTPDAMKTQTLATPSESRGSVQMFDFGKKNADGSITAGQTQITLKASDNGTETFAAVFNQQGTLSIKVTFTVGATPVTGQSPQLTITKQMRKYAKDSNTGYDFNQYDQAFQDAASAWQAVYLQAVDDVERLKAIGMTESELGQNPTATSRPFDIMTIGNPGDHVLDTFHNVPPYDQLAPAGQGLREVVPAQNTTRLLSYPAADCNTAADAIMWGTCWLYQKDSTIATNPNPPPDYIPGPWRSWDDATTRYNGGGVPNYLQRVDRAFLEGKHPTDNNTIWPIETDGTARP